MMQQKSKDLNQYHQVLEQRDDGRNLHNPREGKGSTNHGFLVQMQKYIADLQAMLPIVCRVLAVPCF